MNVLDVHRRVIGDYDNYIRSFIRISDPEIQAKIDTDLGRGKLWPEPLLQFNPAFQSAGKVADLAASGLLHPDVADIFRGYALYQHQHEAIKLGSEGKDFVVTSGTGSGKSLTYIGTIFSHLLRNPGTKGIAAVVVYPLNALINSQTEEFLKYRRNYEEATGREFPISFGQYTGQEDESKREAMRQAPPQVLLTNYMMLELLLTRIQERRIRDGIYDNLRFLVFDELHTYRGRQGADVAMLIRRIRAQCRQSVCCIGTSATMVSGGTPEDQLQRVAEVATQLFGKPFDAAQIVTEKLTTSLDHTLGKPSKAELAAAISRASDAGEEPDHLRSHPVALWLELEAALERKSSGFVRRKPRSLGALAEQLAKESGEPLAACESALQQILLWISRVNESIQKQGRRDTILPFRLHQFISQTGSVYTTLDQGADRFITLEPGIYKSDEENQKPIFPNVFSRSSGHPFICVTLANNKLVPREFSNNPEEGEDETAGYLIVGDVWDPEADLDSLPDAWFRHNKSGRKALPDREAFFPRLIHFDELGNWSASTPLKYTGWFMRAPLLFDPTTGTFFDTQTREATKLAKLGSEGRSTSTTITAFSILRRLREAGYKAGDQKLLSFTDNRQDAALQAGHFNDFIQVVRLRSAIYKAVKDSPGHRLTYATLGPAIFKALRLSFREFTGRDEPDLAAIKRRYEETFQDFLLYRALADLRRSWRIVLPNLEQCALLSIDYADLDEIAADFNFWSSVALVGELDAPKRREFLTTILDFFRLEYALHSENFLDYDKMRENEKHFREQLRSPWTLDDGEELDHPKVVRYERLSKSSKLASASMGPASALGKYIKQFAKREGFDSDLVRGDRYLELINALVEKLVKADYLSTLTAKSEAGPTVPVYRVRVDRILWCLGDGKTVKSDVIKRRSFKDSKVEPNRFFAEVYTTDSFVGKRLRAEDHTGQLGKEDRIDREDRFKCDWWLDERKTQPDEARIRTDSISALFCSPTMELGVDIGGLSVVHMRNAPPNSANYAQRSGRAGRSGQGALVFTYCSTFSSHDRHYFQQQAELVAGAVQPPRLDLCNRELLLTHLNALAISFIGLPGLEAQGGRAPSLSSLVEMSSAEMPLTATTCAGLRLSPDTFQQIRAAFKRVIHDFGRELESRGASWYSDSWIDTTLGRLVENLDYSLGRWRKLHNAAKATLSKATARIESGTLSATSDEYKKLVRQQNQATRQLNLLVNDLGRGSSDLSEFYPYRYLAAEGYLPGYNFTRLPIRIFIPNGPTSGDFISRPRSIALREFGPLNVIYHNGRKYRVDQLVMQDASDALSEARVSIKAGYFLPEQQKDIEICPFSKLSLSDNANKEHLLDLIEATECRATEFDRISCEEEERVSKGYEVDTYFTVDGSMDRIKLTVAKADGVPLLNLRFIPAARLVYVNRKWRAMTFRGFPLNLTTGVWKPSMPPVEERKEPWRFVTPWTSNTADALHIEPIQPLGLEPSGVITLQYALKRAMEQLFQVESNELGVVNMGDPKAPNILIYESSEGSLGILSRFASEPDVLHRVVREALAICRYDDPEYKAKASYDDLLSYYNQRDHLVIDRFAIRGALDKLLACTMEVQTNSSFGSYDAQYQSLLTALDPNSELERRFLDYLYTNNLRLPDSAQKRTPGIYCQPDFFYEREPRVWIFVDGSVHDQADVMEEDRRKRSEMRDSGEEFLVYRYDQDLATFVASRPDLFRRVR